LPAAQANCDENEADKKQKKNKKKIKKKIRVWGAGN
jgi:hypothetical protein